MAASAPIEIRLCADGCGRALPRGTRRRRYLPGHAPNAARALDASEFSPSAIEAFVNYVGPDGQWVGPKCRNGYGRFVSDGRMYMAHRVAWALFRGPIPSGVQINHACDVMGHGHGCVNPWDLFQGSQIDNMRDAAAKGLLPRKLTAAQVMEIRACRRTGVSRIVLAERFGLSPEYVSYLAHGHSWSHLNDPDAGPIPTTRSLVRRVRRTHCFHGHEFTPENTKFVGPTGKLRRSCLTCYRAYQREYARAWRRRRKLEAA